MRLIMDTSTQNLIVSFVDHNTVVFEEILEGKNNHSEHLLATIEKGLQQVKISMRDFEEIIVGIGPGAYTGLRISLTVAKMFAWTLKIKLYTISSLDLIASGFFKSNGIYVIMTKAKKDHVYGKVLEVNNGQHLTLLPEGFFLKSDFLEKIKDFNYKYLITETEFNYNSLFIPESLLTEVKDIVFLEPNYLRGEM